MDFEANGIDDALPERADIYSGNLWFERLSYDCIVGWKGRHNIKGMLCAGFRPVPFAKESGQTPDIRMALQ